MAEPIPDSASPPDDESTLLPALRTWPAVYAFVVGMFTLYVALLAVLARTFS